MDLLSSLAIFAGAALLFVVEPLVAKALLPRLGGSAAVWLSALLFFQTALLAGYALADLLARRLAARAQAAVHAMLLCASLALLPGLTLQRSLAWADGLTPSLRVAVLLGAWVGAPFLVLSTTSPLLQAWWTQRNGRAPYRLYALSNAGSLIGLLAYPFLLEPTLGLALQARLWSWLFGGFSLLSLALCLLQHRRAATAGEANPAAPANAASLANPGAAPGAPETNPAGSTASVWPWLALPFCSSALLSAVTGHLTINVAPAPLLWLLPLGAYLLSLIVCFESDRLYLRALWLPAFAAATAFLASRVHRSLPGNAVRLEIALGLVCFFACAMALHGELARRKPPAAQLTRFYLCVALGSALGSGLVGLLAPALFRTDLDLALVLIASACAIVALLWSARPSLRGLPLQRAFRVTLVLAVLVLVLGLSLGEARLRAAAFFYARDFYGSIRVENDQLKQRELGELRTLVHGTTIHGSQYLSEGRRYTPTGYYGPTSGIGLTFLALQARPALHLGIVGLGAGALAAWCRPGDRFDFYEIDALMLQVARAQFSFLSHCAESKVVLGDARLTLAKEPPQELDLLVLDAFSGDAVPVHLLTLEAFRLYLSHLKPGGMLALHVSNRFLDLEPEAAAAADLLGLQAFLVEDTADEANALWPSNWVLLAPKKDALPSPELRKRAYRIYAPRRFVAWTDDRSSILSVLR